jgi:alpha-tubulin suppressor-like RCC1 family protein
VAGGVSFAAVRAGGNHTCGVTAVGAAYCWGFNGYGQLGDGTTIDRLTPVRVVQ